MLIQNPHRPITRLVLVLAALGLFLFGYHLGNRFKKAQSIPHDIVGVMLIPARPLPSFDLQNTNPEIPSKQGFAERWTLLAFSDLQVEAGARAIQRMVHVHNRLAANAKIQEMLQLVFAAHESLARAELSRYDSPVLQIVTGSPEEMVRLGVFLGASDSAPDQQVGEELPLYLVGPKTRLLAVFPATQTPAAVAADVAAIADHYAQYSD